VPNFGASPGVTTTSKQAFHLYQGFMVVGLIVGGFTFLLIVFAAIAFRRRSDAIPRQTQYNTIIEIVYTTIPALIVAGLFYFTVIVENPATAIAANPGAKVEVVAFQWGWKFNYPGHPVSIIGQTTQNPTMVVPEGETTEVKLVSIDVVHGFYVHQLNFSRYAQPGVTNLFDLHPNQVGQWQGQCTQLCGLYHSLMFFKFKVVPAAIYHSCLDSAASGTAFLTCTNQVRYPTKQSFRTGPNHIGVSNHG